MYVICVCIYVMCAYVYISYCIYFKGSYFNLFALTLEEAGDSRVCQEN